MKLKKTVPVIIISLVLIVIAGIIVLWNMPFLTDGSYLDILLENIVPSDGNVSIKVESVDRTVFRSINLHNVDVYVYDTHALHSDTIRIQMGLFDLISLALSKTVKTLNAMVLNTEVYVDDTVMSLFKADKSNSTTGATEAGTNTASSTIEQIRKLLKRMGFVLDIRKLSAKVRTKELTADFPTTDIYLSSRRSFDLSVVVPNFNAEYVSEGASASIKDLRMIGTDLLGTAEISVLINDAKVSYEDYSADSEYLRISILYSQVQDSNITVAADKVSADSPLVKAVSESFTAFANITRSGSAWGGVNAGKTHLTNINVPHAETAEISNLKTQFNYEDNTVRVSVDQTDILANTDLDWIGQIGLGVSVEANLRDVTSISPETINMNVSVDNFKCEALPYPATVSVVYREGDAEAVVRTEGLYLRTLYNVGTTNLNFSLDLLSMKADDYRTLLGKFVPQIIDYVDKDTELDASLSVSGQTDFINPEGYIGLNVAIRNLKMSSDFTFNGAVSIDADIKDRIADIHTLAVTAMGYRLTYIGLFDLDTLFPQGQLRVTNASDGSELASFNFNKSEDVDYYTYNGSFAFMKSTSFSGQLRWKEENVVSAESVFKTPYQDFPLDITFNTLTLNADVVGPHVNGFIRFNDVGRFETEGQINNAVFHLNEETELTGSLTFDGYYDLRSGLYRLNLNNTMIDLSDIAYLGFDIALLNNRVEVTKLILGRFANRAELEGFGYLDYGSIADLISFNTAAFSGYVNLGQNGREGGIKASLYDNNYSLDLDVFLTTSFKIGMLGQRGDGFYAECGIGDLSFKAEYRHPYIRLFKPEGDLFGFNLDRFNVVYDLNNAVLDGLIGVSIKPNRYEDATAGAEIEFSIEYDSIRNIILSYAGLEETSNASLKLRNLHLGSYKSEDEFNQILKLEKNSVIVEGDVVNGVFNIDNGDLSLSISDMLPVSFNLEGKTGKNLDMMIHNLKLELPVIGQLLSIPFLHFLDGTFTGDLLVKGPASDPSFYGMLYTPRIEIDLFYLPDQTLIANGIAISVNDHEASFAPTPTYGYSTEEASFFDGQLQMSCDLRNLGLKKLVIDIDNIIKPIDFWYPLITETFDMNIRSNVTGHIIISVVDGKMGLGGDIVAENLDITLKIPDNLPQWYYETSVAMNLDLKISVGKDCEFFYPEKDDSFLNFTINEGESVYLHLDNGGEGFSITGNLSVKTGRIYYFQNDFFITDGSVKFTKAIADPDRNFNMFIDLTARLREYDSNGKQVEIYLILQNATLNNIVPRFESSPAMSQAEIMQFLGQSVIQTPERGVSLYSLASFATATADAFSTLGLISQNSNYSLTRGMREALGLDMFSLRSQVIQNLVLSYLPGMDQKDENMVSRYLDGTSLFAGKYFSSGLFGRASVSLNSGQTLKVDIELSVNWDNEMGSFSIFTSPNELSILDFLDNIGFSFSRRILL